MNSYPLHYYDSDLSKRVIHSSPEVAYNQWCWQRLDMQGQGEGQGPSLQGPGQIQGLDSQQPGPGQALKFGA